MDKTKSKVRDVECGSDCRLPDPQRFAGFVRFLSPQEPSSECSLSVLTVHFLLSLRLFVVHPLLERYLRHLHSHQLHPVQIRWMRFHSIYEGEISYLQVSQIIYFIVLLHLCYEEEFPRWRNRKTNVREVLFCCVSLFNRLDGYFDCLSQSTCLQMILECWIFIGSYTFHTIQYRSRIKPTMTSPTSMKSLKLECQNWIRSVLLLL